MACGWACSRHDFRSLFRIVKPHQYRKGFRDLGGRGGIVTPEGEVLAPLDGDAIDWKTRFDITAVVGARVSGGALSESHSTIYSSRCSSRSVLFELLLKFSGCARDSAVKRWRDDHDFRHATI
jgi:hypothetical protein